MWHDMGLVRYWDLPIELPDNDFQFDALKVLSLYYPELIELEINVAKPSTTLARIVELGPIEKVEIKGVSPANDSLALLEHMPGLTQLTMTAGASDDFIHLAKLQRLRHLFIDYATSHYSPTDADLKSIAGLTCLELLVIIGSSITGDGLAHLVGMQKLETLAANAAPVDDTAFMHLSDLKRLRVLSLVDTNVTGVGINMLSRCKNLQHLWLTDTPFTDAGASELRSIQSLRSIDIDGTEITEFALADFGSLPKLDRLDVSGDDIQSLDALMSQGFPVLHELVMSATNTSVAARARLCNARPDLKIVSSREGTGIRHSGAEFRQAFDHSFVEAGLLAHSPADLPKGIPSHAIDDVRLHVRTLAPWIEWLGSLPKLNYLNLSGTPVSDTHLVQVVERCPRITDLDLSDTNVTAEGVKYVEHLPNLTRLTIDPCQVGNGVDLVQRLSKLKELEIESIYAHRRAKNRAKIEQVLQEAFPDLYFYP